MSTVCTGSCDRALPTSGLYRIDAPGVRTSKAFRIEGANANLEAHTASSVGFAGGLALVIGGGLLLVNGLSLIAVAAIDQNLISTGSYNAFLAVGGVLGGVGLVSLIAGALVLRGNLHTTVAGSTTVRVPARRDAPAQPSSRFTALTFPAFSGTF